MSDFATFYVETEPRIRAFVMSVEDLARLPHNRAIDKHVKGYINQCLTAAGIRNLKCEYDVYSWQTITIVATDVDGARLFGKLAG